MSPRCGVSASQVLWPEGEPLVIAGAVGAGKTTLAANLLAAMLGDDGEEVLGYPVAPIGDARRVLYLAMDRPQQIARALRRTVPIERLRGRVNVWPGPPFEDLASSRDALLRLCRAADADVVIIDSLKDAVLRLADDETAAKWNRALQAATTAGIDSIVLHHMRKEGVEKRESASLDDVYGSRWITAGAGSVLYLGAQRNGVQRLKHLKPPAERVATLHLERDDAAGTFSVVERPEVDARIIEFLSTNASGVVASIAAHLYMTPTDADRKRTLRALTKLVERGVITKEGAGNRVRYSINREHGQDA